MNLREFEDWLRRDKNPYQYYIPPKTAEPTIFELYVNIGHNVNMLNEYLMDRQSQVRLRLKLEPLK
jgi:hypothetical protein